MDMPSRRESVLGPSTRLRARLRAADVLNGTSTASQVNNARGLLQFERFLFCSKSSRFLLLVVMASNPIAMAAT